MKTIINISIASISTLIIATSLNASGKIGDYELDKTVIVTSEKKAVKYIRGYDLVTDYLRVTNADKLQELGADGSGTKAIVIDDHIDTKHIDLKTDLTKSTMPGKYVKGSGRSHGTHVSGIITNIAPKTKIRFLENDDLSSAFLLAATGTGDIVNTSFKWGGIVDSKPLQTALQAITDSGKILFKSFGNYANTEPDYINKLINLVNQKRYKGRIILVANSRYSISDKERLSPTSDYVTTKTDHALTAPGSNIYAPAEGEYKIYSGTSMAAPNAAGNFLLLKSLLVNEFGKDMFTNDQILSFLKDGARKKSLTGSITFDSKYGHGVVDVMAAYRLAEMSGDAYLSSGHIKSDPSDTYALSKTMGKRPSLSRKTLKPKVPAVKEPEPKSDLAATRVADDKAKSSVSLSDIDFSTDLTKTIYLGDDVADLTKTFYPSDRQDRIGSMFTDSTDLTKTIYPGDDVVDLTKTIYPSDRQDRTGSMFIDSDDMSDESSDDESDLVDLTKTTYFG